MVTDPLANRAVGKYPISVATSLALESALNEHPELKHKDVPLRKYKQVWVNLRTLFRNLHGSMEPAVANWLDWRGYVIGLYEDMSGISQLLSDHGVEAVFYYSNYKDIQLKYRHALVRADSTDKQKEYTAVLNKAIEEILKNEGPNGRVRLFDLKLKHPTREQYPESMIVTHYAYDLLSASEFKDLVLLESHTGAIKPKAQWHTKFLNGKDLAQIPFNEAFLQVFGDSQTFRPIDIKVRRDILAVAEKYKWSSVTTRDKVMYGISTISNPYSKEILRSMF